MRTEAFKDPSSSHSSPKYIFRIICSVAFTTVCLHSETNNQLYSGIPCRSFEKLFFLKKRDCSKVLIQICKQSNELEGKKKFQIDLTSTGELCWADKPVIIHRICSNWIIIISISFRDNYGGDSALHFKYIFFRDDKNPTRFHNSHYTRTESGCFRSIWILNSKWLFATSKKKKERVKKGSFHEFGLCDTFYTNATQRITKHYSIDFSNEWVQHLLFANRSHRIAFV